MGAEPCGGCAPRALFMALSKFTVDFKHHDKSEVEGAFASVSEPKFEPRQGRYMVARWWSSARGGTPGTAPQNKCEPRRGGIKRGAKYGIVSKCREHDKTRAHNGSELPSPRLAALACYAVARRSSPLYVTTGSLGSISFFVAIQGFRSLALTPPPA